MPSSMLLLTILLAGTLVTAARGHTAHCSCLTDEDTKDLVESFTIVAAERPDYEEVAAQISTNNFTSISDSVNFVDGIPASLSVPVGLSFRD